MPVSQSFVEFKLRKSTKSLPPENGSPAFDEFLELLGEKVRMKGFTKYRAQLDNKSELYDHLRYT